MLSSACLLCKKTYIIMSGCPIRPYHLLFRCFPHQLHRLLRVQMSASSLISIDQQRRQRRTARHVWSLFRSTLRLVVPRPSSSLPKARPRQADGLEESSRMGGVPAWQRALRDSQLLMAEAMGATSPYTTAYIPPCSKHFGSVP